MKNVSSNLDFGTVLNASLQVRLEELASRLQDLELVQSICLLPAIAVAKGITFLVCPSVRPIIVSV